MAALYGFGAAGAQTIEDVLARRLAWEKFRAAQEAENRRLAMAEAQAQREGERWSIERPALESGTRVTVATEPEAMKRPGLLNAATAAGTKASEASTQQTLLDTGEKRKEYGARTPAWYEMQGTPEPWQRFVNMPGGKSPFVLENEAAMKRINAQLAGQSSMQGPYTSEWTVPTTDEKGNPVTIRYGIPRGSTQPVEIQRVAGKTTADIQNRKVYTQEFAKKLSAFESMVPFVSSYSTQDTLGKRLTGAAQGSMREAVAPTWAGSALDPQGSFFSNLQDGLAMTGARVLGSNSQLSDQERESAKKALFPKLHEPKEVMLAKIEFWKRATGMEDEEQQASFIREGLAGIFSGINKQKADPSKVVY